jgi:serine/threonine-protein kinase
VSPKQTIAHYRITTELGEGGMGEVWRATDTKLGRDVAIKVLPEAFAQDADRMARFTREAQVLASLNHPNIAAIYGVEERALVMELVEGPTLAERITQGAIPLDEALPIAKQIADALEYAHERGVVHRDLKPANIKITPEGRVKVLDFGLAKAMAPEMASGDPVSSPTLTMRATQMGMIMGTAAYMSPEQARGHNVDKRADIWAFGVVLYEMVTGNQLFSGQTISDTLAAVLRHEPDWKSIPVRLQKLLRLCLARDPRERLREIGDARFLIDEPTPSVTAPAATSSPRGWIAAAALALALLVTGAFLWRATRPVDRPMLRFSADLGPDAVAGTFSTVAISPDGTRIVYPVRAGSGNQLATRLMDQSNATVLPGTEDARNPFFKPDGQWIGFFAGGKMKKISVQGRAAVTICENTSIAGDRGASWGEDGTIVAALDADHLFRVPDSGAQPEMLSQTDTKNRIGYRWPQILPGGEAVLATAGIPGSYDDASIVAVPLKTGSVKTVARGGYFGRYLSSGHLIYIHQGTLFGVPFDLKSLATRGTPMPIQEEIAGSWQTGTGHLDFSRTGTLVYLSGKTGLGASSVVWMDAVGKQTPIVTPAGFVITPRLSPDGTKLALAMNGDISVYDLQRSAMTRITFTSSGNAFPVWAPDGKHIVYRSLGGGIWWTRADGSAQPQRILETTDQTESGSFSPDGRQLAFSQHRATDNGGIWILPLDISDPDHPKPGKPELFLQTVGVVINPAFSPGGRWLAYASNEAGPYQVYVRPYPAGATGGGQWQISTAGGAIPVWSRSGKELFYRPTNGRIMVVDYTAKGETFNPGTPREWSGTPTLVTGLFPSFDVAPDGKRIVTFPAAEAAAGSDKASLHVTFLVNFFDELRRKLP